jgi:hypothetical protein
MKTSIVSKLAVLAFALVGSVAQAQWFNPCDAYYEGTWGFRGGRSMSINVIPNGGGNVTVTVSQRNGSETLYGTCRRAGNGTYRLNFSGGANNGRLTIFNDGYATGSVANYSYEGYAQ